MKKITDYTVKELRQIAKELEIVGRSKMNKDKLFNAIKIKKAADELVAKVEKENIQEDKQESKPEAKQEDKQVDARKEAEIRVWADVLKTMPEGTKVTVKRVDKVSKELSKNTLNPNYFDSKEGVLKIGNRKTEDGSQDAYIKVKRRYGRDHIYQIENNDEVHFYMSEKELKKIKYGGSSNNTKGKG